LAAERGNGGPQKSGAAPHSATPSSQSDPFDGCERGELGGGGLGEWWGKANEFSHPFSHNQRVLHIILRETQGAIYSLTVLARQCPVTFLLKTDSTVTKAVVKKGSRKAKLNEPVRQVLALLERGALSGGRICPRRDQSSRQTIEDSDYTKRPDHPEDVLEEVWHRMDLRPTVDAFADDHNHHPPSILPTSHRPKRPEQT